MIYILTTDGDGGTEFHYFKSRKARTEYIWENCVTPWGEGDEPTPTKEELHVKFADDFYLIEEAGHWPDGFYINTDEINVIFDEDLDGILVEHQDKIERRIIDPLKEELAKYKKFIKQMASLTTPEDEYSDDSDEYESVEDWVADISDERLNSEYSTFMHMIREAREVLKGGVL